MNKQSFIALLTQAIRDYEECLEEDERSDVIQKLIDNLEQND